MIRKTNAQKILEVLAARPGLDDDELSLAANIAPRQTVNQECHLLQSRGLVLRETGPRGKIVNYLSTAPDGERASEKRQVSAPGSRPAPDMSRNLSTREGVAIKTHPAQKLFIIPCSKKKKPYAGKVEKGPSIFDELPPDLADQLDAARKANYARAHISETTLVPAWKRYNGTLYVSVGKSLENAVAEGWHILILSGGYGVVLASEPIGIYEAVFRPSWWKNRLIERVLAAYAARHGLTNVRAIVSATTSYKKVVERVDWHAAGIDDAMLITPEPKQGGATIKSPRAQGEALAALFDGTLAAGWTSSDGLLLQQQRLA